MTLARIAIILLWFMRIAIAAETKDNTTPVIGILSQPLLTEQLQSGQGQEEPNHHYIAASYVKWLESGGARSIPIPYDASPELIEDIFGQIHGVLLPGGASELPSSVPYLLKKAVASNNEGNYFPVWGTCLGFEFLVKSLSAGGKDILDSGYVAENMSLPLLQVQRKQLYADARIHEIVTQHNVTMNNHNLGLHPDRFQQDAYLSQLFEVTSINYDGQHQPFVSTIEPMDPDGFPVYGVQYHPEKNAFEYGTYANTNIPREAIDHSLEGITFSMYTSSFLVDLARRSKKENPQRHAYTDAARFPPMYTYPVRQGAAFFEQIYLIPPASHFEKNQMSAVAQTASALRGSRN